MANRSLAAKAAKAQRQARSFAQDKALTDMSAPHTSKEFDSWQSAFAPDSEEDGVFIRVASRRRHRMFEAESMSEFRRIEALHNVQSVTNVTSKKPSRRFQSKPKIVDEEIRDEFGTLKGIKKPISAASTGGVGDWARRTGAKVDVGMKHVLAYYDMIFDQKQAQARMDRNDMNARQER